MQEAGKLSDLGAGGARPWQRQSAGLGYGDKCGAEGRSKASKHSLYGVYGISQADFDSPLRSDALTWVRFRELLGLWHVTFCAALSPQTVDEVRRYVRSGGTELPQHQARLGCLWLSLSLWRLFVIVVVVVVVVIVGGVVQTKVRERMVECFGRPV